MTTDTNAEETDAATQPQRLQSHSAREAAWRAVGREPDRHDWPGYPDGGWEVKTVPVRSGIARQ